MADVQLPVDPRVVTGKKVKALRRQGITPAHLYGHATESQSLQASTQDIIGLLRTAGRNAIIDLQINGESATRPVVMRGVQRDVVTGELIHVDFLQISLTEKLRTEVPLVLTGTAPAVSLYSGVLLQSLDRLAIEALPTDVPEKIDVDVSGLETLEAALFVRDLGVPPDVEVLADPDRVVAKVAPPRLTVEVEEEEVEEEEGAEVPEGEEGEAEAEAGAPEEQKEDTPAGEGKAKEKR